MQIAQALAGYSLGDADNLRRAMGKKKAEVMARERDRFLAGVETRGTANAETAGAIFDQMETFAAYGFNKSHSAAYAVITYQTAYLKAHHPTEFMAGLLSLEAGDADSTYKNIAACRERRITVRPPDVNASREDFSVVGDTIRFGLGAVKGIGSKAIESIIAARADGSFTGLHDFCLRVRGAHVNRRVLESLITCGAFDSVEPNRAALWAGVDDAMRWAAQRAEEAASPQMGLFDGAGDEAVTPPPLAAVPPWPPDEALQREREAIGLFITGHPLDRYERDLWRFTTLSIGELRTKGPQLRPAAPERPGREGRPRVKLGGVIHGVKLRNNKRGDRYATFSLEDRQGVVEAIAWADTYRRFEDLIAPGTAVVVDASLEVSTERCQIIVQEMLPLAEAREQAIRQLHVRVPLDQVDKGDLDRLREVLTRHPGACEAFLHLERPDGMEMVVALPESIRVAASDAVVDAVERLLGSGATSFR